MSGPVVISGAGPAGLVAAIGLRSRGMEARLLERVERGKFLADAGGAYELTARSLEILDAIGAGAAVRRAALHLRSFELRDWRDRSLQRLDFAGSGFEIVSITRSALQRALLERLVELGGEVECGQQLDRSEAHATGVSITSREGDTMKASWLIAADGVHSGLRRAHFDDAKPIDLGFVATWGTSSFLDLGAPGEARGYLAPGCSVVVANAGASSSWTACIAGVAPDVEVELSSRFSAFPAAVGELMARSSTAHTRLFEQRPLRSFVSGHVVLIGDAAHGMAPFLGMGANSAIEDAWSLVETGLQEGGVAQWSRTRARSLGPLIGQARRLGRSMHSRSRLGHALFRAITRAVPAALVIRDLRRRHVQAAAT